MLIFHLTSSLPIIKTAVISTLLIGTVQLMTGCDSQSSSSNNDAIVQTNTAQTNTVDKDMAKNDEMSVNPSPTDTSAMDKAQRSSRYS